MTAPILHLNHLRHLYPVLLTYDIDCRDSLTSKGLIDLAGLHP